METSPRGFETCALEMWPREQAATLSPSFVFGRVSCLTLLFSLYFSTLSICLAVYLLVLLLYLSVSVCLLSISSAVLLCCSLIPVLVCAAMMVTFDVSVNTQCKDRDYLSGGQIKKSLFLCEAHLRQHCADSFEKLILTHQMVARAIRGVSPVSTSTSLHGSASGSGQPAANPKGPTREDLVSQDQAVSEIMSQMSFAEKWRFLNLSSQEVACCISFLCVAPAGASRIAPKGVRTEVQKKLNGNKSFLVGDAIRCGYCARIRSSRY